MVTRTRSEVLVRCGISVVKKWNTTSVVWDYFGLQANPNGRVVRGEANYAVCRSCGVFWRKEATPRTHLRDHHPDLYAKASPKVAKSATAASSANENRQPTLLQSIEQSAKNGAHSSIFVCVWYKCAIRENLKQSWLYCRSPPHMSYPCFV